MWYVNHTECMHCRPVNMPAYTLDSLPQPQSSPGLSQCYHFSCSTLCLDIILFCFPLPSQVMEALTLILKLGDFLAKLPKVGKSEDDCSYISKYQ